MKNWIIFSTLLMLTRLAPATAQENPAGPRPPVEIIIAPGEASAVPFKRGVSFANGGAIDVKQPNPTTMVITLSGLTATNADLICTSLANYHFELNQGFEVCFHSKRVKGAQMTLEGRVNGLLRTNHMLYTRWVCLKKCPLAETQPAVATVSCGPQKVVGVTMPARATSGCVDLSVYNHEGPFCAPIAPGKFVLHETWGFGTVHPSFCVRGASAEFSPQPNFYSPQGNYWFQTFLPFNGQATRDFGFQVVLKVIPEFKPIDEKADDKGEELPPPKMDEKGKPAPDEAPKEKETPKGE